MIKNETVIFTLNSQRDTLLVLCVKTKQLLKSYQIKTTRWSQRDWALVQTLLEVSQ